MNQINFHIGELWEFDLNDDLEDLKKKANLLSLSIANGTHQSPEPFKFPPED